METYARPARSAAGAKQKAGDLIFGSFYALTVVAAEVDERRVEIGLVDRPWEAFVSRALFGLSEVRERVKDDRLNSHLLHLLGPKTRRSELGRSKPRSGTTAL